MEPGQFFRTTAMFFGAGSSGFAVMLIAVGEYRLAGMCVVIVGMQVAVYGLATANDELKTEIRRLKGEA